MSYGISLAYATRGGFPFSTYGENFFITLQNVAIILMILYFTAQKGAYSGLGGPSPLSAPASTRSIALKRVATGATIIALCFLFLWNHTLCSHSTRA